MPPTTRLYDPKTAPLEAALHFTNTVLAHVLRHPGIWVFSGIHLVVFVSYWSGLLRDPRWEMDKDDLQIITGITAFFQVFYTNLCYKRYNRFWFLTKNMSSRIYDFAFTSRLLTESSGKPYARVSCRWLIVTHLLFLNERKTGQKADRQCWNELLRADLVCQDDVDFLSSLETQQRVLIILHMTGDLLREGLKEVEAPLPLLQAITQSLLGYRDLLQEVEDLAQFPVPFGYFHLLSLMITINVGVWAWSMARSDSFFAPLFFFVTALILFGMMETAQQLADPFGNDDTDFPLQHWTVELLHNLEVLLGSDREGFQGDMIDPPRGKSRFQLDLADVQGILFGSAALSDEISREHVLFRRGLSGKGPSEPMLAPPEALPLQAGPAPWRSAMAGRAPLSSAVMHVQAGS